MESQKNIFVTEPLRNRYRTVAFPLQQRCMTFALPLQNWCNRGTSLTVTITITFKI